MGRWGESSSEQRHTALSGDAVSHLDLLKQLFPAPDRFSSCSQRDTSLNISQVNGFPRIFLGPCPLPIFSGGSQLRKTAIGHGTSPGPCHQAGRDAWTQCLPGFIWAEETTLVGNYPEPTALPTSTSCASKTSGRKVEILP